MRKYGTSVALTTYWCSQGVTWKKVSKRLQVPIFKMYLHTKFHKLSSSNATWVIDNRWKSKIYFAQLPHCFAFYKKENYFYTSYIIFYDLLPKTLQEPKIKWHQCCSCIISLNGCYVSINYGKNPKIIKVGWSLLIWCSHTVSQESVISFNINKSMFWYHIFPQKDTVFPTQKCPLKSPCILGSITRGRHALCIGKYSTNIIDWHNDLCEKCISNKRTKTFQEIMQ